ncbi:MAG: nucleotide sugar dehydrogenase [Phycisphaeraceae bacterium]|nr:nucleotide sugar dehydrogenase [Phycisphaeraceae bacterium]
MPTVSATLLEDLRSRIDSQAARVAVLGLGYVGLPILAAFHDAGYPVLGFDTDPGKISQLKAGRNYLPHLGPGLAQRLAASARFEATSDAAALARADVFLICVPTPLGPHQEPDLSFVLETARAIGANLPAGRASLVVLESSTYPGTTRDELAPAILSAADNGRGTPPPSPPLPAGSPASTGSAARPVLGETLFVAFSPEREDPGSTTYTTRTIPKLVGGLDGASRDLAAALYSAAVEMVVPVSSAEVAESAKLLENIYRAVNIALANEMKTVLDGLGIDVWEVIEAASTKPFGFMPFYPGPGLGGHCIPVDPFYLSWKAREAGIPARFIELAGEINHAMPGYVVARVSRALNASGRAVKGARVLVMGLAYKPDVADVRESPSFELIELLLDLGALVSYADPFVKRTPPMRRWRIDLEAVEPDAATLATQDCVLISTAHSSFDYAAIARHARLVVDTRNAMRPHAAEMGDRLVRA